VSRRERSPEPEPPAAEPMPDWKALLGAELSEPRPERSGPAAAAGPGRGRR
jgi:hypothetical protein